MEEQDEYLKKQTEGVKDVKKSDTTYGEHACGFKNEKDCEEELDEDGKKIEEEEEDEFKTIDEEEELEEAVVEKEA